MRYEVQEYVKAPADCDTLIKQTTKTVLWETQSSKTVYCIWNHHHTSGVCVCVCALGPCFWEVTWLCRAPRRLPWEFGFVCCLWRSPGWNGGLGRLWADWSRRLYQRRRDEPSWPVLGGETLSSPRLAGGPRPWHSGPYRREQTNEREDTDKQTSQ